MGRGVAVSMATVMVALLPENGRLPVNIWYKMTPSA
jgi:hypothetical protein